MKSLLFAQQLDRRGGPYSETWTMSSRSPRPACACVRVYVWMVVWKNNCFRKEGDCAESEIETELQQRPAISSRTAGTCISLSCLLLLSFPHWLSARQINERKAFLKDGLVMGYKPKVLSSACLVIPRALYRLCCMDQITFHGMTKIPARLATVWSWVGRERA